MFCLEQRLNLLEIGKVNLKDSYANIKNGELYIYTLSGDMIYISQWDESAGRYRVLNRDNNFRQGDMSTIIPSDGINVGVYGSTQSWNPTQQGYCPNGYFYWSGSELHFIDPYGAEHKVQFEW